MDIVSLESAVVKDKVVIVRVDFNVPLQNGVITENTRIVESIPTLQFLLDGGAAQIHILSHMGRPKGKPVPELSLKVIVPELEKLLGETVEFRNKYTPGKARIQLHENLRFNPGETKSDPDFIQELLGLKGDIFVNDGFAVCHRAHASVVGLASYLPAYPGVLVEKEIKNLRPFLKEGKIDGLTVVTGGAKIKTKIGVLKHFGKTADNILIGGALSNTFLLAEGFDVGKSFCEPSETNTAQEIVQIAETHKTGLHLPVDVICGDSRDAIETVDTPVEDVMGDMQIFDIGKHTIESFSEILQHSKIIVWNGPVGIFENKPFENGTKSILKVIAAQKSAKTILGGGDTLEALKKFGVEKSAFSHVSTGGGAMLEFLEGKELPGIEVLMKK